METNEKAGKSIDQRFAENVKRLRIEKDFKTLDDLVIATEKLGPERKISKSTLSRIESQSVRGPKPRSALIEELETLAAVFGVEVQELLRNPDVIDEEKFHSLRAEWVKRIGGIELLKLQAADLWGQMESIAAVSRELRWWLDAMRVEGEQAKQPVDGPTWKVIGGFIVHKDDSKFNSDEWELWGWWSEQVKLHRNGEMSDDEFSEILKGTVRPNRGWQPNYSELIIEEMEGGK